MGVIKITFSSTQVWLLPNYILDAKPLGHPAACLEALLMPRQ